MVAATRGGSAGGGAEGGSCFLQRDSKEVDVREPAVRAAAAAYIQPSRHGDGPGPVPVGPDPSICPRGTMKRGRRLVQATWDEVMGPAPPPPAQYP